MGASDFCTKSIEHDDGSDNQYTSRFYSLRAQCSYMIGKKEDAYNDNCKLLELDPTNIKSYLSKGLSTYHLGNLKEALEVFNSGLNIDPDDDETKRWKETIEKELGESAENITTNKQASSATSTNSIETFQLDFYRVDVHFLFSEKEKKAIYERFNDAKQFLINVISADPRCTRVWANIIGGAYEKITVYSSPSQIFRLLFTSSTITTSILQELIATKIIIAIVHPDAAAASEVLDPIRTKEYATTTRFEDKALIAINPMVFNNDTTSHGSRISRESCTLFLAILLSHEITHAVKYISQKIKTTPQVPFFRTYSCLDEYDGGNALEHELFSGEMHINHNYAHTNVELFIIGSRGQHFKLSPSDIHNCLTNNSLQSLSSLVHRLELKRRRTDDSRKTHIDYFESTDYENKKNDEKFVPLLHYHTRTSVFQETDNVDSNQYFCDNNNNYKNPKLEELIERCQTNSLTDSIGEKLDDNDIDIDINK
ncbi:unnamed protein product [Rotaria sordida]|uniref:Uncharacterized protein n=1 Tax=Rotaria sordida TaxID=392033 RepID=A0A819BGL0_9BILA|nr:unnamed protein product [Rotaria sordida]